MAAEGTRLLGVDDQDIIDAVRRSTPTILIRFEDVDPDVGVLDTLTKKGLANINAKPTYTPGELGKIFFARSADWVRWCERSGHFGEHDHIPGESRTYTLVDIQRMAFALHDRQRLPLDRLVRILRIVREIAQLHRYLPDKRR